MTFHIKLIYLPRVSRAETVQWPQGFFFARTPPLGVASRLWVGILIFFFGFEYHCRKWMSSPVWKTPDVDAGLIFRCRNRISSPEVFVVAGIVYPNVSRLFTLCDCFAIVNEFDHLLRSIFLILSQLYQLKGNASLD